MSGAVRRRDLLRWGVAAVGGAAATAPRPGHAEAPHAAVEFPLRAAPDGRTLVDRRGRPFFMLGDSPQTIYANVSLEEADWYLATRQAQGFNTLMLDPCFTDDKHVFVLRGANGHFPFRRNASGGAFDGASGTADFADPDPAYWDYVDTILAHAEARGFLALQYVLSWGFDGHAMWRDLTNAANTAEVCYGFGKFLGQRFKGRANLLWVDGSDFNGENAPRPPDGTGGMTRALAITRGMLDAGARQLRTGDWKADSLSTDQAPFAPFMAVNGVYAYGNKIFNATYVQARRGYARTPPLPVFLKETGYEAENLIAGDPTSVRKYEWWALLSGATAGVVYGHRDIWPFTPDRWRAAVTAPGALDMQRMGALMRGLPWYDLVPSGLAGMRRLVVSRNGAAAPPIPDYAAAAAAPDGRCLLAYLPPAGEGPQSLTLDLGGMSRATEGRWWDPTSAWMQPAGSFPPGARPTLTSPGRNAGGANDWVLLIGPAGRA